MQNANASKTATKRQKRGTPPRSRDGVAMIISRNGVHDATWTFRIPCIMYEACMQLGTRYSIPHTRTYLGHVLCMISSCMSSSFLLHGRYFRLRSNRQPHSPRVQPTQNKEYHSGTCHSIDVPIQSDICIHTCNSSGNATSECK